MESNTTRTEARDRLYQVFAKESNTDYISFQYAAQFLNRLDSFGIVVDAINTVAGDNELRSVLFEVVLQNEKYESFEFVTDEKILKLLHTILQEPDKKIHFEKFKTYDVGEIPERVFKDLREAINQ